MSIDTGDRIPLREAAIRLTGYRPFRNAGSGGKRELLRLLQGQKIRAAFDFPSKAQMRIDIPSKFWIDTHSGDFLAQLTTRSGRGRHGQFLIDPAKFIEQYATRFSDDYLGEGINKERQATAAAEVASALVGMKTKKEAYILESEWARFVQDIGLDQVEHRDEIVRSNKGRRPREGWDIVLVEVASEMLARQERGELLEGQQSKIAEGALARVKASGRQVKLEIATVAKKISDILDRKHRFGPAQ